MLLKEKERKRLKWLHRIETKEDECSVGHYRFVSDGKETKDDIRYIIDFAERWYESNGYQIIENYDELKKTLESLQ